MSGLAGSIAIGEVASKTGGLLRKVPREVWYALALILALWLGSKWHEHRKAQYGAERFMAGYAKAVEDGRQLKEQAELIGSAISKSLKEQNDETNRRIDRLSADLRLRGPGAASARCPGVSSPSGQSKPTSGAGNAPGTGLPEQGGSAVVPWDWLVERAEQCDLNRAEVLTWRDWWERQNAQRTQP